MQIRIPDVNILIVVVFQVKKHLIYTDNILFSSVLSVSGLDIMIDISFSHWQEWQKVISQVPSDNDKIS